MVPDAPNGVLLVDKPAGITSHAVVSMARRALGTKRVGHAGTLDPAATGLLVLGVGPSTRLLTFLVGLGKTYEATIALGASTTTDDAEGETVTVTDATALTQAQVEVAIGPFTGKIEQVPSTVSAIKVDGKRAYASARAGEDVVLEPRAVRIDRFDVGELRGGELASIDAVVECSSGTYIRALARDLGASLGVGGHLTALRRTRVGAFDVADAVPADAIAADRMLTPARAAASALPTLDLDADAARLLRNGRRPHADVAGLVAAIHEGELVGVARGENGRLVPVANMAAS